MRRMLFQWRGFTLWSYPAMLYCGLVVGVAAGNLAAHRTGLDAFRVFVATLVLIPPSIIGARLLFVATHWDLYRNKPRRIWSRQEGGMAMYGGMPVMLLFSLPLLKLLDLGFGAFWDVGVITIVTAMVFTKIGCLLNGCCAGRASRTWMTIVLPGVTGVWEKRIPVQMLESGWAAILLVAGALLLGRLPFRGALFLVVAAAYAAGRMCLEFLREREPQDTWMPLGHVASLLTIISALAILEIRWPR
jgi:phosphatidylglycerol---prolipoprotein diacylglyceryl transferase